MIRSWHWSGAAGMWLKGVSASCVSRFGEFCQCANVFAWEYLRWSIKTLFTSQWDHFIGQTRDAKRLIPTITPYVIVALAAVASSWQILGRVQ